MERKLITDKNKFVGIALTEHELNCEFYKSIYTLKQTYTIYLFIYFLISASIGKGKINQWFSSGFWTITSLVFAR